MADLSTDFLGIKSPNPFWLASAPPPTGPINVVRALKAGWGGVVWKTLGEAGTSRERQRPALMARSGERTGGSWGSTTPS